MERFATISGMDLKNSRELEGIINPLLNTPEIAALNNINHHGNSILHHSLKVCHLSWRIACKLNLDRESVARGALLHDFFLYDWKTGSSRRRKFYELHRMHGFTHAREALKNAETHFKLNEKERDIILKHMFPLTLRPPRYAESWLVNLVDTAVSLTETGSYLRHIAGKKRK